MKNNKRLEKIHDFFEHPSNIWAYLVQIILFALIFISAGMSFIEFYYPALFNQYKLQLEIVNHVILAAFTIEYVLRLVFAPKKLAFIKKPMNIVDFLAIAPNYIELILPLFINTEEVRVLRVVRLLRLSRLLRTLKIFEYSKFLNKVFVFQNTISEAIFPVLLIFTVIRCLVWILETEHLWVATPDLSSLFGTMGFALGIILAQKITVSYSKFLDIEQTIVGIYGKLRLVSLILDKKGKDLGKNTVSLWTKSFLNILTDPKADNALIHQVDKKLYGVISKIEKEPADLTMLFGDISKDAAYCLSKKIRLTPKAYDVLLHQATILYLVLMALFIPGIVGLVSVLIATYLLYGMYELTEDFDSILGGPHNLINVEMTEIKSLINVKAITKSKKGNKS